MHRDQNLSHGTFQGLECVVLDEYLVEKPQNYEEKTKEKGQQVFNLFVLHTFS